MKYYNQIAKSYNELHGEEQIKKAKLILKLIKPYGKLLDIGAGTGIATKLFEKYCDCIALDPSEELLKQYKANEPIVRCTKNKKFLSGKKIIAKAESLPFKDKTFDIIISLTALHHTNINQAIKEINRVKKQKSIIAISFLKKSKKLEKIKNLLKDYKQYEQEKDIVFIKH